MELIAASSGTTNLVRPVIALQGDLTAVLREGRVLSGEVMQSLDGGSILVGIGEHRVPVQSQVKLPLGQRLLFLVESRDGKLVLRLLSGTGGDPDPLMRAIRGLLGSEVSAGRLLGHLRSLLQSLPGSAQALPFAPADERARSASRGPGGAPDPASDASGGSSPAGSSGEPSASTGQGRAAGVDAGTEQLVAQLLTTLTGSAEPLPSTARASLEAQLRQVAEVLRQPLASPTGASESTLSARLNESLAAKLPELGAVQRARIVAALVRGEVVGSATPRSDAAPGAGRSPHASGPPDPGAAPRPAGGGASVAGTPRLAQSVDPLVVAKLAGELERLAFRPGADGAALREAIGRNGQTFRLATLAALFDGGRTEPGQVVAELARALTRALEPALARQAPGPNDSATQTALRELVEPALRELLRLPGLAQRIREGGFEVLVRGFVEELAHAARPLRGALGERVASALAALDPATLLRGKQPALLAALLAVGRAGGRDAEPLVKAVIAGLAGPGRDLSGSLLAGLLELPEGSVRDATVRSLAGIELENLLNLARRESGESYHWSFPLPDGSAWTTAHLFARVGDDGRPAAGSEDEAFRLTLGVEFTHLGPVRGDLVVRGSRLSLRLRVTRADVAERLRGDLRSLQQELSLGGGEVMLSIVHASPSEAGVDELLRDIRFLREHHVMDMQG